MANIVEVAQSSGRLNTFVEAVTAAGLDEILSMEGPFTVFAPTDEAFSAIPKEELDRIMSDVELLKRTLLYHVVDGRLSAKDIVRNLKVTTQEGADLVVTPRDGGIMINAARVIEADLSADNGVIHVVDLVLAPQSVAS